MEKTIKKTNQKEKEEAITRLVDAIDNVIGAIRGVKKFLKVRKAK